MEWNRSNAIGLALASCTLCEGHGMVEKIRGGAERPCECVFRAIFRACYRRFRECSISASQMGSVSVECTHGPIGKNFYSRKREEYAADFLLVTRRVLTDLEYKIFRFVFLLGADGIMTAARLNLERGNFFHLLYRMEQKLGLEYCELQPYPLYPLDEYFGALVTGKKITMPNGKLRARGALDRSPMVRRRDPISQRATSRRIPLSA